MKSENPYRSPESRLDTRKRIGVFLLVSDSETEVVYQLDTKLRWLYLGLLLAWLLTIVFDYKPAFAALIPLTIGYFAFVWWPGRSVRHVLRTAMIDEGLRIKGSQFSFANPVTYRVTKAKREQTTLS